MQSRPSSARGFTLIELMIVIVVVAILSTIAYPAYQEHVRKARRAQAKADLIEYAQLAERYHTANNTYVGFTLPVFTSPRDSAGVYTLTPNAAFTAANTFTITATPSGAQTQDPCGTLSLNQAGVKTVSSSTVAACW